MSFIDSLLELSVTKVSPKDPSLTVCRWRWCPKNYQRDNWLVAAKRS